ncbi:MAG: tetratricopeptide repeat protein [Candidatus Symbiothrix sp.]|jgi:hypothetical protein|nr:tetratricopeptide repeat protein [Candidatus Symbiothrix sp.]
MKHFIYFSIAFLFLSITIRAQSVEDARKLYSEGKYAEALPLYEKWSVTKKLPEAYYSLGNMYYSMYEFEKSVAAYTKYTAQLTKEKKSTDSIMPLIQRSERAARMLSRCENIQIIDSVIVDKANFLNAYLLSSESGRLENKDGHVIYENPLKDKRFFAGKKGEDSYRLFSEIKLQNTWSERKELNLTSDSIGNEDYPFVLPDGLTLYYASNGPNSIGGYDLFITRYNLNNDTYLASNQMGMPFNSIANDYMLAIDELNNTGYFATDRFQPEDKVVVYTFIPNEEIVPIETEDAGELISRAKIVSIQDSWKPDVNYAEYLKQVRNAIRNEQTKTARDFFFPINDQVVYYTLKDFKKDAARQAFLKSKELEKTIHSLENELDGLRLEYAQASDAKKERMQSGILSKEERLYTLLNQYKQAEITARNAEMRTKN